VCGSSGTVFFRGFQRYIDPRKLQEEKKRTENDRAKYLPENTNRAENIYAENKRK
jgi:hypothetical protein